MSYARQHLDEAIEIIGRLDIAAIEAMAALLARLRAEGGRLFFLGVGGSAGNCSHAVNDFRKIVGIEAYAPTDNVSELTARTNDEGWASVFVEWLKVSRLTSTDDAVRVLGWRRQPGEEHQPQPGVGAAVREAKSARRSSGRRPRRRLYRESCRRLRDRSDRESGYDYASLGGLSGRRLAPAGLAPRAQAAPDQMGVDGTVTRRAVFLDRDGVINRVRVVEGRPYPPRALAELEILTGVAEALQALREDGFLLIVATNQPDVARGTTSRAEVDAINARLMELLALDDIRVCFHDSADGCECRKPRPGLLADAARDYAIDLARSFMVGDRWRDIEAGRRAGCTTLFIDDGYAEKQPEHCDYDGKHLCPRQAG